MTVRYSPRLKRASIRCDNSPQEADMAKALKLSLLVIALSFLPLALLASNYIRKSGSIVAEFDGKYIRQNGSIVAEFDGKYMRVQGSIKLQWDGKYIRQNGSIVAELDGKYIRKNGSISWEIEPKGTVRRNGSIVYTVDGYTDSEVMRWKLAAYLLYFAE